MIQNQYASFSKIVISFNRLWNKVSLIFFLTSSIFLNSSDLDYCDFTLKLQEYENCVILLPFKITLTADLKETGQQISYQIFIKYLDMMS